MDKKFKLGFMVGRMQPIHKGHQQLIDLGLELCERFVILLGSSNESRTKSNPLTFTERYDLIKKIYGDKVEIYPIVNIGIGFVPEWGNYIMNTMKFYCDSYPDFYIGGVEEGRKDVFNNYPNLSTLYIGRDKIDVSATQIRDLVKNIAYPMYMNTDRMLIHMSNIEDRLKQLIDEKIVQNVLGYRGVIKDTYKENNGKEANS